MDKDEPPAFSMPWGTAQRMSQQSNASNTSPKETRRRSNSPEDPAQHPKSDTPDLTDHEDEARDQPMAMSSARAPPQDLRARRASVAPMFSSPFGGGGALPVDSNADDVPRNLGGPRASPPEINIRRASVAPAFSSPFGGGLRIENDADEARDMPRGLGGPRVSPPDLNIRRASVAPAFSSPFGGPRGSGDTQGSGGRAVRIELPQAKPALSPAFASPMNSPFSETTPFSFSPAPSAPTSKSVSSSSGTTRVGANSFQGRLSEPQSVEPGRRKSIAPGAMGSLFGGFAGFGSAAPNGAGGPRKSAASVAPFEKAGRDPSPGVEGATKLRANVRKNFASSRLAGEIHKPWLDKRDGRETAARWFYIVFSLMGLVGGGLLAYFNFKKIPRLGKVCLVLDEQFNSFDTNIWHQEVEVGGFGNGEFEWTTTSSNNSFVEDGILYIVPTLTEDVLGRDAVYDGQNITVPGCTAAKAPNTTNCITYSNSTLGKVLNPVMSARLSTKISHSIKYGRVEVRARMPTGDWLWPAIWMLPTNNTYGDWPASGEIDIAESRGNGWKYGAMGSDWITSTIHWGPLTGFDSAWRTTGKWQDRHSTYSDKWHTFVVEWDEKFMWIYLDKRTVRIFNHRFKQPFWDKGEFPPAFYNGTHYDALPNPWQGKGNVAPFDQEFYLILNVAVGGTNGWFPDNIGDKPWYNDSPTAMKDFIDAKDKWYPTWPADVKKRGMAVDWVRMYQKC